MEETELFSAERMYFTYHACDEPFFGSHSHDEYEIMYLADGPEELFCLEDQEYTIAPRSLLLIPAGRFHSLHSRGSPGFHHLAVHFQKQFLDSTEQQYLLPLFDGPRMMYFTDAGPVIDALMRSMSECSIFHADLRRLALKSRIVSLLTEAYHLREKSFFAPFRPSDKRITAVLEYICGNFTKPLSLDGLSRDFAIGKNHLNTLFREETGETVGRYIRKQRLNFAHREIMLGKGAEEAAYEAGFNDYSVFFKSYKALFGAPPTRQRKHEVYTLPLRIQYN